MIIVPTGGLLYLNETIHGKFSGYLSISEIPLSAPCWLPAAWYSIFTKKWIGRKQFWVTVPASPQSSLVDMSKFCQSFEFSSV